MNAFLLLDNVPILKISHNLYGIEEKYNELFWNLYYLHGCGELGIRPDSFEFTTFNYNVRFNQKGELKNVPRIVESIHAKLTIRNKLAHPVSLGQLVWTFIPFRALIASCIFLLLMYTVRNENWLDQLLVKFKSQPKREILNKPIIKEKPFNFYDAVNKVVQEPVQTYQIQKREIN